MPRVKNSTEIRSSTGQSGYEFPDFERYSLDHCGGWALESWLQSFCDNAEAGFIELEKLLDFFRVYVPIFYCLGRTTADEMESTESRYYFWQDEDDDGGLCYGGGKSSKPLRWGKGRAISSLTSSTDGLGPFRLSSIQFGRGLIRSAKVPPLRHPRDERGKSERGELAP